MRGLRVSARQLRVVLVGGVVGAAVCWSAFVGVAGAALPDGRAYELVSQAETNGSPPVDTTGGVIQLINDETLWFGGAVTPVEGDTGASEPMYAATRGKFGWSDASLSMAGLSPYLEDRFVDATRADVGGSGAPDASVWQTRSPLVSEPVPPSYLPQGLYYRDSEGSYSLIASEIEGSEGYATEAVQYGGMSANGETVVYQAPIEPGAPSRVYAWHPGKPTERLSTGALSECGAITTLGAGNIPLSLARQTNSVSEDGSTVFMESAEGGPESCPSHPQVYVNHDGVVTLISAPSNGSPLPAEAPPAWFVGATPDGQTAYFLSQGDLTAESPSEPGDGTELYQWNAGQGVSCVTCKAGVLVGGSNPYEVAVSRNGRDVWMVSSEHAPNPEILYLYSGGRLQASPGPEVSGQLATPDFAISPSGETVAIELQDKKEHEHPTSAALYRVSDSTGTLEQTCISCVGGVPYEGSLEFQNDQPITSTPGASTVAGKAEDQLSSNGETIVFTSAAALTPEAHTSSNALPDAYEWNQERGISLIAEDAAFGAAITPDGSNIFFSSSQDLTPNATQSSEMLYDARVGGGFPQGSAPVESTCAVESTCQGSAAAVALPAVGATPSAGNVAGGRTGTARLGEIVLSHSQLASLARDGTATVRLQSDGPGTVMLMAKCTFAGHSVGCARATASSQKGGRTLALRLRLSRSARDALAKSGRLRLNLTATLAGASARHASFALVKQTPRHEKRPHAEPSVKRAADASEVQR